MTPKTSGCALEALPEERRGFFIDNRRYVEGWLTANARIIAHPQAAHLIVSRYSARDWKDARRTAICAAGFNTPLWQEAVAEAYPRARQATSAAIGGGDE